MEVQETGIVLPAGVDDPREHLRGEPGPDQVVIDNRTDLPDGVITEAVEDYFVENASLAWGHQTNFQIYANEGGSLLARREFRTPANVIDEIKLARSLAERDDDVAPTMGQLIALAFGDGMENQHKDDRTRAIFNGVARNADLDMVFMEMYRELLIAGQVNTAQLFTVESIDYQLSGSDRQLQARVAAPLVGVLPSEQIRVLGNDLFKTATLAYEPESEQMRRWLDEYFNPQTTAARKAEMGRQDRILAALFTGVVGVDADNYEVAPTFGNRLYKLNPRMVHRTTYPKGSWRYPRPLLTRDFALLEAKRLLNIMDFALLQGGSNFIVVAKKGSDQRPAQAPEVRNLERVVQRASKTGVIVGDHRLSFEIITPKLEELLNSEKRTLIGRKLSMAMLRIPEHATESPGSEGMKADVEMLARVAESDRRILRRHIERHVYGETVKRNPQVFNRGAASIWFPKIILQGLQYFTDLIIKLRDRGDIPRSWGVEAAGFDWDAAVQQRKRELDAGDDEVMQPGSVPHSSPEAGPQDNGPGRPSGARDGTGQGEARRPTRVIQRNRGETIRAWVEDIDGEPTLCKMGDNTYAILDAYQGREVGRVTGTERAALDEEDGAMTRRANRIFMPVNPDYIVKNEKAIRLTDGLSVLVGEKVGGSHHGAIVAKLLTFREPDFNEEQAHDFCVRWGFPLPEDGEAIAPDPTPELAITVRASGDEGDGGEAS